MTTPVFVRLAPGLHKMLTDNLAKVMGKAIDQIRKAHEAGLTVTITSPDARTIRGRKRITEALRHAGLEPEIVSLLGWDTTYPGAVPAPALETAALEAESEASDPPTLTEE